MPAAPAHKSNIMAIFLKGITGAYSGKIGNVIGSNWRSIDYIRSLPKKSNKKASEAQLRQRAKFALSVAFFAPIKDVLNLGFSDSNLKKSSGFNMGLSAMMKTDFVGEYPDLSINYADVKISKGSHASLDSFEMIETAAHQLTLHWSNTPNLFNSFGDDVVIVLLYHVREKLFSIFENTTRAAETCVMQLPATSATKHIVGWVFTMQRDGAKTSDSQYLGERALI